MLYHGQVVHRHTSSNIVPWSGGTPVYQVECCTMVGWYTDVPGQMLYHGLCGTPAYQVECCTMVGWYTDVPGQMLYHGWVVHRRTRSNVVPCSGGTPTYQVECYTMVGWYTDGLLPCCGGGACEVRRRTGQW